MPYAALRKPEANILQDYQLADYEAVEVDRLRELGLKPNQVLTRDEIVKSRQILITVGLIRPNKCLLNRKAKYLTADNRLRHKGETVNVSVLVAGGSGLWQIVNYTYGTVIPELKEEIEKMKLYFNFDTFLQRGSDSGIRKDSIYKEINSVLGHLNFKLMRAYFELGFLETGRTISNLALIYNEKNEEVTKEIVAAREFFIGLSQMSHAPILETGSDIMPHFRSADEAKAGIYSRKAERTLFEINQWLAIEYFREGQKEELDSELRVCNFQKSIRYNVDALNYAPNEEERLLIQVYNKISDVFIRILNIRSLKYHSNNERNLDLRQCYSALPGLYQDAAQISGKLHHLYHEKYFYREALNWVNMIPKVDAGILLK